MAKRKLSAEARARIGAAQKKRWAKIRAAKNAKLIASGKAKPKVVKKTTPAERAVKAAVSTKDERKSREKIYFNAAEHALDHDEIPLMIQVLGRVLLADKLTEVM